MYGTYKSVLVGSKILMTEKQAIRLGNALIVILNLNHNLNHQPTNSQQDEKQKQWGWMLS
jgi:hypothetical protein